MKHKVTYQSSGVNIAKANRFVRGINRTVAGTLHPSVLKRSGAFGGLFALGKGKYKNPVLVSSTDGVGTKLLVARAAGKHDTVGIDLVAMNVNDILCTGARPLFFLDYIACGRLNSRILNNVVKGIAAGCRQAQMSLIGGETAEMPGMYKGDDYDLAGFAVGVVERNKIIDGSAVREGDRVLGLASSGLHSNGFSLVRRVFSSAEQKKMAAQLLKPTRIYVKPVLKVLERFPVKGIAHITGGAFYDKLTKIVPPGKCIALERGSWPVPNIFQKIQKKGKIDVSEMYRTFNMGIGLAMVVRPKDTAPIKAVLSGFKIKSYEIGTIIKGSTTKRIKL